MNKMNLKESPSIQESSNTSSEDKPYVILVLQGGGALGAYQIGVYEAMAAAGLEPDWVAGISIGSLNSCIIAGNKPENRLKKLEEFWEEISVDSDWKAEYIPGEIQKIYQTAAFNKSALFGISPFFKPHNQYLGFNPDSRISYYNTTPMLDTLQKYSSFEKLNSGKTRISVGASNVCTGELVFFDNTKHTMKPEHILASGSLPPAFPPQRIDGDLYWDGGCVSNTPLEVVMHELPHKRALVFVVDLWNAYGDEPTNMEEVSHRMNNITYADRSLRQIQKAVLQRNLAQLAKTALASGQAPTGIEAYTQERIMTFNHNLDIVHLVYEHKNEVEHCAGDFTHHSIKRRRKAGLRDAAIAIKEAPWVREDPNSNMAAFHEVRGGQCFPSVQNKHQKRFAFYGE